jgi:hypothetical protein
MRHRWAIVGLMLVTPACAAILGIEDGTPRDDASVDATTVDVGVPEIGPPDVAVEAEAGPPPLTVPCGDAGPCIVGVNECCRKGSNPNFTYACVTDASACTGNNAKAIPCDRAEVCAALNGPDAAPDAAPQVCCADTVTTEAGTSLSKVVCTGQQACLNTGVIMCPPLSGPDAAPSEAGCPAPRLCKPSVVYVPGYYICQ